MSDLAAVEGEDVPDDKPARVVIHLIGGLAKVFQPNGIVFTAWGGKNALRNMVERMKYEGYRPDCRIEIVEGGSVSETTLGQLGIKVEG